MSSAGRQQAGEESITTAHGTNSNMYKASFAGLVDENVGTLRNSVAQRTPTPPPNCFFRVGRFKSPQRGLADDDGDDADACNAKCSLSLIEQLVNMYLYVTPSRDSP